MSLKKHFIKLMEDVDMGYQAPFDANSGQGITKFAPTPANKVLKSYNVDGDFLRKAIGHGGVPQQAVDQIMTAIDGQQADGPLGGGHFDTIMGGFGIPLAGAAMAGGAIAGGAAVPPVGSGGDGMGAGAVPPAGDVGATDTVADIDPVASDMSAGEPAVPGSPVDDGAVAPEEGTPVDAGAGAAVGGAETGSPVDSEAPPVDGEGPVNDDGAVDEGERSMSPEEQAAIRNGQTIGKSGKVDTTPGDEAEGDEDAEPEQVDPRA
jgi:hypothetical protein